MLFIRSLLLAAAAWATSAAALEYPIGVPQHLAGMEVAAVYLQAIDMEPDGHMRRAADSDIHLEADMMPMVASDGAHYGDNVKLKGPGRYKVKFIV